MRRSIFSLVSVLLLVTAQLPPTDFVFTSPVSSLANNPPSLTLQVDKLVNVQWTTNLSTYSIFLLQQFDGNELSNPVNTTWLLDKTASQPEEGGFSWNISFANLTHYDIFNFQLGAQDSSGLDVAATEGFNITDKAIVITTTSRASSSTTPIVSSPSTFTSSIATSSGPSPTVQPAGLQSTSTSTTTPKSSSINDSVYIGIGVGLGLFLGLSLCLGFFIKCSRKRRHQQQQTTISSHTDSNSTSEMDMSPFKSKLSTPLNVIRSFLFKSELPGKDNERPKFELPGKDNEQRSKFELPGKDHEQSKFELPGKENERRPKYELPGNDDKLPNPLFELPAE